MTLLAGAGDGPIPRLDDPAEIVVYISPDCPNCPRTVAAATQLAAANEHVTAQVVDISHQPDRVAEVGIRSVPMAVINQGLTLVGAMSAAELADKIVEGGGAAGHDQVLASLVEAGRLDAAGEQLAAGSGHDGFLELWRKSSLESRMGLVLSAQSALEAAPDSLDSLVPGLVAVLDTDDAARRGDTADLLGMIGHPAARSALELLLKDPVDDVAEIASDALEGLRDTADPP
jgi:glutaredoxin